MSEGKRSKLSLEELVCRKDAVPAAIEATLERRLLFADALRGQLTEAPFSWDVVGLGASEGPARLLASVLQSLGHTSRYLPISQLLERPHPTTLASRGLVVFSQGLSPNAQIALEPAQHYGQAVLITATTELRPARHRLVESFPGAVLRHLPESEPGGLLRLVGPPCAALTGLLFALELHARRGGTAPKWETELGEISGTLREEGRLPAEALGADLAACLAVGTDLETASALCWKWQEALYARLPVAADVLGFAHGALQSFYEEPAVIMALHRPRETVHELLWPRLEKALHASRHRIVPLTARLPGPLAFFEFDAACNAIMLAEMQARNIDPGTWPGQSQDAPLYQIDSLANIDGVSGPA